MGLEILNVELTGVSEKKRKGTVRVILSDPPYKDGNAWLTTVPDQ